MIHELQRMRSGAGLLIKKERGKTGRGSGTRKTGDGIFLRRQHLGLMREPAERLAFYSVGPRSALLGNWGADAKSRRQETGNGRLRLP